MRSTVARRHHLARSVVPDHLGNPAARTRARPSGHRDPRRRPGRNPAGPGPDSARAAAPGESRCGGPRALRNGRWPLPSSARDGCSHASLLLRFPWTELTWSCRGEGNTAVPGGKRSRTRRAGRPRGHTRTRRGRAWRSFSEEEDDRPEQRADDREDPAVMAERLVTYARAGARRPGSTRAAALRRSPPGRADMRSSLGAARRCASPAGRVGYRLCAMRA